MKSIFDNGGVIGQALDIGDRPNNAEAVTILLNGNGNNTSQNNTFIDSSANNFTITRNGNSTQGTFSPFSLPEGYWSGFFDGIDDHLTVADNNVLDLPGDFTIEFWIYPIGGSSSFPRVLAKGTFQAATSWAIGLSYVDNTINFEYGVTPTYIGAYINRYSWNHVAIVRSGTTLSTYVNGVPGGSGTVSNDFTNTNIFYIGRANTAADYFKGHLSNIRIVKGTVVYTSSFVPTTSPLTNISGTSILTCNDNRFRDDSSNALAITTVNGPQIQPFGPFPATETYSATINGGSGYFDGTGDYLGIAASSNLNLSSGDWTVELWWYPTLSATTQNLIMINYSAGTDGYAHSRISATSGNSFNALSSATGTTWLSTATGGSWTVGQWHHLAYVRNGSAFTLYLNGTSVLTYSSASTLFAANGISEIGRTSSSSSTFQYTNGYISDARVVKGTAVYTANFTPPTAPLTAISNTQLLTNFTNAGIIDSSMNHNLETVGNVQISTIEKKFNTGSIYFDGAGDYLFESYSPLHDLATENFTFEAWVYPIRATTTGSRIFSTGGLGAAWNTTNGWHIIIQTANGTASGGFLALQIFNGSTSAVGVSSSIVVPINSWSFVTVSVSGNSAYLGVNGTVTSGSITGKARPSGNPLMTVGIYPGEASGTGNWQGYIDDLKITKGLVKYTKDFTVPSYEIVYPNLNARSSGVWSLSSLYDYKLATSYTIDVITSGLELYLNAGVEQSYPGSGNTWFDLSGNNKHLTLSGTSFVTDAGGGVAFSSTGGSSPSSSLSFSGGGFTISVWLRHTGTVDTSRVQRYFTLSSSPGEGPVLRHNSASAASLHGYLFDSGFTFRSLDITGQIVTATYYNLVYTYNGSTFKLYRNATEVGTTTLTVTLPTPTQYRLAEANTEYFQGNIYIAMYYNRGLSAAEITQNYNTHKARFGL